MIFPFLPVCHLARAKRSRLFKEQSSSPLCAAKKEHYYGFKILLVTTESGIPIDYTIDTSNVDEQILLTNTSIPANSIVVFDKGFISERACLKLATAG